MKPKEYEGLVPKLREDFHPNEMTYPLEQHEIDLLVLIDGKTSAASLATLKSLTSGQVRKILSSLAAKEVVVLGAREKVEAVKVGAARAYIPKGPFHLETSASEQVRRSVPSTFPPQTPAPPTLQTTAHQISNQQGPLLKSTPSRSFRTPQIRELQSAYAQGIPAPGNTTHLAFTPKTSTKPARFVPLKHAPPSANFEEKEEQVSNPAPPAPQGTLSTASFEASTSVPEAIAIPAARFGTHPGTHPVTNPGTNPGLRSLREELLGDVLSMDDGQQINRVLNALTHGLDCLRSTQSSPQTIHQALTEVYQSLVQFFETQTRLTLQVRPFELVCNNRVAYRNQNQDSNLAYLLYSDGIRAISFQHNLCWQELAQFLLLLVSQEEEQTHPKEDFVTLFWNAAFQTIDILSLDETFQLDQSNETPATRSKAILAAAWDAQEKADKAPPTQQAPYYAEDLRTLVKPLSPAKVHYQPISEACKHALWEELSQENAPALADHLLDFLVQALRQPTSMLTAEVIRRLQNDVQRQKRSKQNKHELLAKLAWLIEQTPHQTTPLRYEQRHLQLLTDLFDAPNRKEIIETQRLVGGPKSLFDIFHALQKAIASSSQAYIQGQMCDLTQLRHATYALVDLLREDPIESHLYELMLLATTSPPYIAHALQVTLIALLIGVESGLPNEWLSDLAIASSLHNMGHAPGAQQQQVHSLYGAMLFAKSTLEWTDSTVKICLSMTEYHLPFSGQKQKQLFSRIIHIADVYSYLTRPVGATPPLSPAVALQLLWGGRGTHFEAILVQALTNRLGMYPPGTLVALQDQAVGVSLGHRGGPQTFARPVLWLVGNKDGQQCSGPLLDLQNPEHDLCQIHNALKANQKANQYIKRMILRAMGQRIYGNGDPIAAQET